MPVAKYCEDIDQPCGTSKWKGLWNYIQYFVALVLFTFCTCCILRCLVCIVVSCLVFIVVVVLCVLL